MNNFDDSNIDWNDVIKRYQTFKNKKSVYFTEEEIEALVDYLNDLCQLPEALELIDWALKQYPYTVNIRIKQADIFIVQNKAIDALSVLHNVYEITKYDIDYYILTAECYLILKNYPQTLQIFNISLSIFKNEEEDFFHLLYAYIELFSDYEAFDILFECLCQVLQQPQLVNEEIMFTFAVFVEKTKRYQDAIPFYQKFIDKKPFNFSTWFNLANAFQQLKLYEKAIDAYLYAIAIHEDFELIYRQLAICYIKIRHYNEAIIYLDHLINEKNFVDIDLIKKIAYCYFKIHDYNQSRIYYIKACKIDPTQHQALFQLAQIEYHKKQFQKAYDYIQEAINICPKKAEYYYLCAQCFLQLNNIQDGLKYLAIATNYKTSKIKYWEYFLLTLLHSKSYEKVKEAAHTAWYYTGKDYFQYFLAISLWESNNKKEALSTINNAIISNKEGKNLKKLLPLLTKNQELQCLIASNIERYL